MNKLIENGIVVSIGSPKSGVGKSVITSLVVSCIHKLWGDKLRVAAVDCDDVQYSLHKFRERDLEAKDGSEVNHYRLLKISSEVLPSEVEFLRDEYDIIFIDLPSNLNQQTLIQCYNLVDVLIVPTKVNSLDWQSTIDFLRIYKRTIIPTRENLELGTAIYGLLSGLDVYDANFLEQNFEKFRMSLPVELLQNFVPDYETSTQRKLTTTFNSENFNCKNYEDLSREMLNKIILGVGNDLLVIN